MRVYYITDEMDRILPVCDWREDIEPDEDWKVGDLDGNAYEDHGIPLYKDVDGTVTLRTLAEIRADIDAIPVPEPTETERLRADVDYLTMENEALESESEQARADIDYLLMITEED